MSAATEYIDITWTWESAVNLYVALLMDPGCEHEVKMQCKQDLLRLAKAVDAEQQPEQVCDCGADLSEYSDTAYDHLCIDCAEAVTS